MLIRVMLCFLGKVEGVSRGIAVSARDTAQLKRREYALSLHPIKGAGFWRKMSVTKVF